MRLVAMLFVVVLGVSGCGEKEPTAAPTESDPTSASPSQASSATPSATPPPMPRCARIWVAEKRFPQSYRGCRTADGTEIATRSIRCESGQLLHTFQDRFYAVSGGKAIRGTRPLAKDAQFMKVHRACTA